MNQHTWIGLVVGIVCLVAAALLISESTLTGQAICPPSQQILITSGTQHSLTCMNSKIGGLPGYFSRKSEGEQRRYNIAQRSWSYDQPTPY